MKIVEVKVYLLRKKLTSSMTISRGGFSERLHAIVEVVTDTGHSGLGEGIGNALYVKALIEGGLAQKAIGKNPLEFAELQNILLNDYVYFERKGSLVCAVSAIEMACIDILGKYKDIPAYEILGGKKRDFVEAYVSDIYWEEDPRKMGECAKRILEQGFSTLKAHIGHRGPEEDLRRIEAIRNAVGEKVPLMIDLNCGYSLDEAIKAFEIWNQFNLYWMEEPVHPDDYESMSLLTKEFKIPLAAGENEFGVAGFKELFEKSCVSYAMPDIGRAGGMLETQKICRMAKQYGVTPSIHNFSSGVLLSATLQVMAATPECELLEFDSSQNAVYQELLIEPLDLKDGRVKIPDLPGLGVLLRKETLKQYLV